MAGRDALRWVENASTASVPLVPAEEWARFRQVTRFLAWRDLKVRYKQAFFGAGWAIAQPVAAAALFTFVFRRLADVPSEGLPYVVFALAGTTLWSFASGAAGACRASLLGNAALLTRVYFPRLALPAAALLPAAVDLAVASAVLVVVEVLWGVVPGPQIVLAPAVVVVAAGIALGTGSLFGSLSVHFRDVHHVFTFLIQLWLFASPVAYPSSLVDGGWRWVYALNPLVGTLDLWRWTVADAPAPGPAVLLSLAVAGALLVAGLAVFRRLEGSFADVI